MRKLLIVDDERHVTDSLYELFALESSLELDIYKAYTAREALGILERIKIDVVLSDVRMPGMSGLELARHIGGRWPMCRVVFLTGAQNFEYIYEAEKLPGSVYLMKTEDDDVILEAVKNQLDRVEAGIRSRELLEETLTKSSLLEQSICLRRIADGKPVCAQQELDALNIPVNAEAPILLAAGRPAPMEGEFLSRHYSHLYLILQKQISHMMRVAQWMEEGNCFYWILQPEGENRPDPKNVRDILEDVQSAFRELLGIGISFALSSEYILLRELPPRADRMRVLLRYQPFSSEQAIVMDDLRAAAGEEDAYPLPGGWGQEPLEASLLRGDRREDFLKLLEESLAPLRQIRSMHHPAAIEQYLSVALLMLRHINRTGLQKQIAFRIGLYKLPRLDAFGSWEEAAEYLSETARALFDTMSQREESCRIQVIGRIKDYVAENIGGDLSLAAIADRMKYNPSYISRLFKQAEGKNLSEYIIAARLAKARELLGGSGKSINEIAAAAGFYSPQYFATVFKKHVGTSPHQYRLEH